MQTRLFAAMIVVCILATACVIQPIQPEAPAPAPVISQEEAALAVVEDFNAQTSTAPLSMKNLDAFMDFYADDCDFIVAGPPGEYIHIQGKQPIRDYCVGADVQFGTVFNFEPLAVQGSQAVVHNRSSSEMLAQYGAGEFDGLEVFVVKAGKFVADYYMASAETNQTFARLSNLVLSPDDAEAGIVQSAVKPWIGEGVTSATIDETLKWYANDASFLILGLPTGVEEYRGKEALRPLMQSWVDMNQRWEVTPLSSAEGIVVGVTRTWLDPTVALGIAPVEATEIWIIKGGMIQQDVWAITPNSLKQLVADFGE